MNNKNKVRFLVQGASIAALYVILTFVSSAFGLSSGVIQLRLSEALCILPIFTPSAIWGLFLGCIIANTLTGSILLDVVFGSLATLIGAVFTRILRKKKIISLLPPIISNTLIIPFVLKMAYGFSGSLLYIMLTVGVGEILSSGVLGYFLLKSMEKQKVFFKERG